MPEYKDLHIANNIEALNRIALKASQPAARFKKPAGLLSAAKKIYLKSQADPYDEEMTFILLSRFLQVYEGLKKVHNDSNYIALMLGKEARKAEAQLTELTRSLEDRYQKQFNWNSIFATSTATSPEKLEEHPKVFNTSLFVSCTALYGAYTDPNIRLLIMDVRSDSDFQESHIKGLNCINIPDSCVQSGLSAHTLEAQLPTYGIEQWQRRDSFDVIVLLDWSTTSINYTGSKLEKLRTILTEWDPDKAYKEKPVVLNEGYIEFLEMYPTFCTSSDVKYKRMNAELDDLLDLDSIEYPMESELKTHEVFDVHVIERVEGPSVAGKSRNEVLKEEKSVIELGKRISNKLLIKEQEWKDIHERIVTENDANKLQQLQIDEEQAEENISQLVKEEDELLAKKYELADHFNLAAGFEPNQLEPEEESVTLGDINKLNQEHLDIVEARQALANDRQLLLDEARSLKKRETTDTSVPTPIFDRRTKPILYRPPKMMHMEGKLETVPCGLTGLVNIRNTCYMNTIIQCLRHIPELIRFYCTAEYANHIKRIPPVISNEVAHLVRCLWSSAYAFINPLEFYNRFTSLSSVYKAGQHEDCMEFFLELFNYLTQDCAFDIPAKKFWSETQMAWYKQHGGKVSFFNNLLYHQTKIKYSCSYCKSSSIKYDIENIFYLSVPDEPFKLLDVLEYYFNDKEQLFCKKCNGQKLVIRHISYYPSVLILSLKRHIQDFRDGRAVCYKKNASECYFPTDSLKLGRCRYALYAIALHEGNMETGHYTAACRNPVNKKWYVFNDDIVNEVDINTSSIRSKAYTFFYSYKHSLTDTNPDINEEVYPQ